MNKAVLIGRLTKDPELRYAAGNGTAVCKFTLAINRQFKKDETDFINCVSFGKAAETIAQYMSKGRQLAVTGSIRTGSYDAQDGTKRYTTDVAVDGFEFVGGQAGNNTTQGNSNNSLNDDIGFGYEEPIDEGSMPF